MRKLDRTSGNIFATAIVVALGCILFLVACTEKIVPEYGSIEPGANVSVGPIELRIRSEEELQRIYKQAGKSIPERHELRAFIGRDLNTGRTVLYSPPPQRVDDYVTCSIGHEFMHAAYGSYHD